MLSVASPLMSDPLKGLLLRAKGPITRESGTTPTFPKQKKDTVGTTSGSASATGIRRSSNGRNCCVDSVVRTPLCPAQICTSETSPPGSQNVTVFGDWVFKEVMKVK